MASSGAPPNSGTPYHAIGRTAGVAGSPATTQGPPRTTVSRAPANAPVPVAAVVRPSSSSASVPSGAAKAPPPGQQHPAARPANVAAKPPQGTASSSSNTTDFRIISRAKLSELARQLDGEDRLDEEAAKLINLLADDFVESVTTYACRLAKHRKSNTVEVKDVQLHLERTWGIRIAGFGGDDDLPPSRGRKRPSENYKQRLASVKKFKK